MRKIIVVLLLMISCLMLACDAYEDGTSSPELPKPKAVGITGWTPNYVVYETGKSGRPFSLSYGNGIWIMLVENGRNQNYIYRSSDNGENWDYICTLEYAHHFQYSNGVWVAAGAYSIIRSTDDGLTWNEVSYTSNMATSINWLECSENGIWVAVGSYGVWRSTDNAKTWSNISTNIPISAIWYSIAYGNSVFIATTACGLIIRSEDYGETWDLVITGTNETFSDVEYGDGIFLLSGTNVLRSIDNGIKWEYVDGTVPTNMIEYGNGVWIAHSGASEYYVSLDSVNWEKKKYGYNIYAIEICYGDGLFLIMDTGINAPNKISRANEILP